MAFWGVPWAETNDLWRAPQSTPQISPSGLAPASQVPYDPSWGAIKPFLTQETECDDGPVTRIAIDSYQQPGAFTPDGDPDLSDPDWKTYTSPSPPVTGCETLGFGPDIEFAVNSRQADDPTGLSVELSIPQNNDPKDESGDPLTVPDAGASEAEVDAYVEEATEYFRSDAGRATSHLKDTVVTLPDGLSINPAGATGLTSCSDDQIGVRKQGNPPLFNNGDPFDGVGSPAEGTECPQSAKIGTVEVHTPLLEEKLTGDLVLGEPKSTDPQSGQMFRLFIVLRNQERGLLAKVYGV